VLLNGVAYIPLGLLHGPAIAEAAGHTRTVGGVALVFGFLLNYDLERVVLHRPMIPRTSVHEKPLQPHFNSFSLRLTADRSKRSGSKPRPAQANISLCSGWVRSRSTSSRFA
jgi:hypothetical protein